MNHVEQAPDIPPVNTHRPRRLLRIEADLLFDRLSYCFPAEPRTTSMTQCVGQAIMPEKWCVCL